MSTTRFLGAIVLSGSLLCALEATNKSTEQTICKHGTKSSSAGGLTRPALQTFSFFFFRFLKDQRLSRNCGCQPKIVGEYSIIVPQKYPILKSGADSRTSAFWLLTCQLYEALYYRALSTKTRCTIRYGTAYYSACTAVLKMMAPSTRTSGPEHHE